MKPPPHWRPGHHGTATYQGPMVQCPNCAYATWRAPACAFCGAPLGPPDGDMVEAPAPQAEALAGPRPGDIARGLPTLFLAWFLVGLLAGVAGFSPHGRAAGTLVWSHVGRLLSTVGPSSPTPQSYDLPAPPAPRDTAPARPAAAG